MLASELSWAEQHEQQRISTELHDGVSQMLSSACLRLGILKESPLPEETVQAVDKISEIVQQTLGQIRSLTFELSCPMLNELGLAAALEELCEKMSHEHGVSFEFQNQSVAGSLLLDQELVLYRSTRELLNNVMKHSGATRARVELRQVGELVQISVEDDGKGFDASKAGSGFSPSGGFGLFNLREHIQQVGGGLQVDSVPGQGTRIVMTLPVEVEDE